MTEVKPYLVRRDGMIVEPATGRRIGRVIIRRGRWTGYLLGADYPADPWDHIEVDAGMAGRRWSVARAVWQAWKAGERDE